MFRTAGVSGVPRSGLWASEFLRLGFSNRHVPDSPGAGKDWRDIPAAHVQGILQHLPSGKLLFPPVHPEGFTANKPQMLPANPTCPHMIYYVRKYTLSG